MWLAWWREIGGFTFSLFFRFCLFHLLWSVCHCSVALFFCWKLSTFIFNHPSLPLHPRKVVSPYYRSHCCTYLVFSFVSSSSLTQSITCIMISLVTKLFRHILVGMYMGVWVCVLLSQCWSRLVIFFIDTWFYGTGVKESDLCPLDSCIWKFSLWAIRHG